MPLKLINIEKSFGDKKVISNFTYCFENKGLYSITGESGVGKTTLLRIISKLDKVYGGTIESNLEGVSFAFQEQRLFPQLSAIENVVFAICERKDEAVLNKAKTMLNKLGISDSDFSLLPSELSGGMKQRVSLARAFLYDADILLLDEPTKELDDTNAKIVREIIAEQAANRLVIMVSHNKEDIISLNATEIPLK